MTDVAFPPPSDVSPASIRTSPRPRCPLCDSPGTPKYTGMRDRLYSAPGTWTLARCSNARCGLLWLDPMPLTEDLHIAYQQYFTHAEASESQAQPRLPWLVRTPLRAVRKLLMALGSIGRDVRMLNHFGLENAPPGRILELGAGDGGRVKRLREKGWEVDAQDVDPHAQVFRLAGQGVRIHRGPLESLDLPPHAFDVIGMNHVLEHLPDPVGTLRRCAALLKPGGKVVAITPNTDSLCARVYGFSWMALEPPRHLHLFNARNLADLARQAGYASATVQPTGANGAGVALGSRHIRATGRFNLTDLSRSTGESALISAIHVIEGVFPSLGEECVLVARTSGPSA
jgi:2-polyprenyl-3-methyl-5-hydroxy-6-metoxy-1,4-benzoquinol methylase